MVQPRPIAELLGDHPMFDGLGREVVDLIAGCARNVVFAEGALLVREGAPTDTFHLVRAGRVALETRVPGRGRAIVETLGPGDFVEQNWLVPPYVGDFDARAVGTVRAIAFDAGCLRGKCEDDPAIGYALLKRFVPALVDRLESVRLKCLDVYGPPPRQPALESG